MTDFRYEIAPKLRQMIEQRFGKTITYSFQCVALSEAIYDKTGERLGITTIKRLFGFTNASHIPRKSTLDIIARYLGFSGYEMLKHQIGDETMISDFTPIESIETEELEPGSLVSVEYEPNRFIELAYKGNFYFTVIKSEGSKLQENDEVKIMQIAKGFELLATEVLRQGESMGSYVGAKQGGVKYIFVTHPKGNHNF